MWVEGPRRASGRGKGPPGSLREAIAAGPEAKALWRRRAMLTSPLGRQVLEMPSYDSVLKVIQARGVDYDEAFAICQSALREELDAELAAMVGVATTTPEAP